MISVKDARKKAKEFTAKAAKLDDSEATDIATLTALAQALTTGADQAEAEGKDSFDLYTTARDAAVQAGTELQATIDAMSPSDPAKAAGP